MVEFGFVWIRFCIGLGDTFSHHFSITLLVAGVLAIRALHACSILEKFSTKGATHDVVELLLHELVTVLLMYLFLSFTNSSLSTKADIKRLFICSVFCWRMLEKEINRRLVNYLTEAYSELYSSDGLQRKPGINEDRTSLRYWTSRTCGWWGAHTAGTTTCIIRPWRWLKL